MTDNQVHQFNRMLAVLIRISKEYMTPEEMQRQHDRGKGMGPSYQEELEMAYENIQSEAAYIVKGVKGISPKSKKTTTNKI